MNGKQFLEMLSRLPARVWLQAILALISFVVLVIGGLGSMGGALLGGLLVGTVTSLGVVYVSSAYADVYAYVLMLAVLFIRPAGLFTRAQRVY